MTTSQEAFIAKVAPLAQEVEHKYGVPASIVIAQAALETGWGEHVKGNNYFGIKAAGSSGPSVTTKTHEVVHGHSISIMDNFRAYSGLADSVKKYGQFLAGHFRYNNVVNAGNAHEAADALQDAGYATDPQYASKLKDIIDNTRLNGKNLTQFDDKQYANYEQGDGFEKTRKRFDEQRKKDPVTWEKFMNSLMDVLKSMVDGLVGFFSGSAQTVATSANQNSIEAPSLPNKPRVASQQVSIS